MEIDIGFEALRERVERIALHGAKEEEGGINRPIESRPEEDGNVQQEGTWQGTIIDSHEWNKKGFRQPVKKDFKMKRVPVTFNLYRNEIRVFASSSYNTPLPVRSVSHYVVCLVSIVTASKPYFSSA